MKTNKLLLALSLSFGLAASACATGARSGSTAIGSVVIGSPKVPSAAQTERVDVRPERGNVRFEARPERAARGSVDGLGPCGGAMPNTPKSLR